MSDTIVYPVKAIAAGTPGSLDAINGNLLNDGDAAIGIIGGDTYTWKLDADSGATANSPWIVAPTTNAGTKRWVLSKPYPVAPNKNYIINGSFNVWQRGTSFPDSLGVVFTADRWQKSGNAGVQSQTQTPTVSEPWRNRLEISAAGQSGVFFYTRLPAAAVNDLVGKTVTFSCWFRLETNAAEDDARLFIFSHPASTADDWTASTNFHTDKPTGVFNTWVFYETTFDVPANGHRGLGITYRINTTNVSTLTYSFAHMKLELGGAATPFVSEDLTLELAACLRYYDGGRGWDVNGESNLPVTHVSAPGKNYIINGSFNVWQRGTSFPNTLGAVYTADRWLKSTNAGVAREQVAPVGGVPFRNRLQITSNNKDYVQVVTRIESQYAKELAGKPVTLSLRMKLDTNTTEVAGRFIYFSYPSGSADNFNTVSYITGFAPTNVYNEWTYHKFTFELLDVAWKGIQINIRTTNDVAATIDYSIANVKLELGSVATPYVEEYPAVELTNCQRYYCKSYSQEVNPGTVTETNRVLWISTGNTRAKAYTNIPFPVTMRATPTLVIYSPGTGATGKLYNYTLLADSDGVTTTNPGTDRFSLTCADPETHGGAGGVDIGHALGAYFTAEAEL